MPTVNPLFEENRDALGDAIERLVRVASIFAKPAGEVCGIKFYTCDKRTLPPGCGIIVDSENPRRSVIFKTTP